jgi:DNA modification methylase
VNLEKRKIGELKFYPGNPRKISDDMSDSEEPVLDLFSGSGSTLIACEHLNRTCYTIEIDPYYCDVIIDRWETYTGQKAEKL